MLFSFRDCNRPPRSRARLRAGTRTPRAQAPAGGV